MPLTGELAEMAYLQTHPVLLDDERLRRAHPGLQKTPYGEGISATLRWARRQAGHDAPAAPPNRGGDRFSSAD